MLRPLALAAALIVPAAVLGQATEENVRESTKALVRPIKGARTPDLEEVSALIVRRVNAVRDQQRLAPLTVNRRLTEAAENFAAYMARTDRYGHQADGSRPAERVSKRGYDYCIVAENIGYHYSSSGFATEELAARLVQGWLESPGHRRNLLDFDVTDTGVALARSEQTGHFYAVQLFARPKSMSTSFRISNDSDTAIRYESDGKSYELPPRFTRTHEQCRAVELAISWPDRSERTVLRAGQGDRFSVRREETRLVLRKL
jgi:uncharacterized protein YkwD